MRRSDWVSKKTVKKEFSEKYTKLQEMVHGSVGAASMCWSPRPGKEVFNSIEAKEVGDRLLKYLEEYHGIH